MFAMPGLRAFSLTARGLGGVSCDADGVYVGDVPLLTRSQASGANKSWIARPISQLNDELSALYRIPIDAASKANALALIATAFNRGDMATAAIATVQMQFPNPPPVAKGVESRAEIERRSTELYHSALLKFWDPAKHPRTGTPPNAGWFAPVGQESEAPNVVLVGSGGPFEKPRPWESLGGGGGSPSSQLELPYWFPRFWSRPRITEVPAKPPSPRPGLEVPLPDAAPRLPLPSQPPQLAPYVPKGKTSGIFRSGDFIQEFQSGVDGPAALMPKGTPGFDGRVRSHAEGHAAAWMRLNGLTEGTLEINNPTICKKCLQNLPKALPPGSTLYIELPNGTVKPFKSREP
jgi:hypothetical protein